jgi:uncharacterized protein
LDKKIIEQMDHQNESSIRYPQLKKSILTNSHAIEEVLGRVKNKIAPLWDIRDYVAVNPLFGYRNEDFLEAIKKVHGLQGTLLLPRREYLKTKYQAGEIQDCDLSNAIQLSLRQSGGAGRKSFDLEQALQFLNTETQIDNQSCDIKCLSDQYDFEFRENQTQWVTNEISKWASAYFDEGQSMWRMPKDSQGLFASWKKLVVFESSSRLADAEFKVMIDSLPSEPQQTLLQLCARMSNDIEFGKIELENYFLRLLNSVSGWASFIQKIDFERNLLGAQRANNESTSLVDLLAMRLAYDLTFIKENINKSDLGQRHENADDYHSEIQLNALWLAAHEIAIRRSIAQRLNFQSSSPQQRPMAQMAFCIDVRSEVIRRHIENHCEEIQTIGFAGFFGLPISIKKLGFEGSDHLCPVLIKPSLEITEKADHPENIKNKVKNFVFNKYGRRDAQFAANSSFSLAETFGFSYAGKMLSNAFGLANSNIALDQIGAPLEIDFDKIDLSVKVQMAQGALTNMGLTKNFAKYVFFFGHGGESTNNPYESALDCGACAGHNGKFNARFLAGILNSKDVRHKLSAHGIDVPEDTVFISGWHNTTRDVLVLDGVEKNDVNLDEFELLRDILQKATQGCRSERAQYLLQAKALTQNQLEQEVQSRAQDWSEIRPEWALAKNHSFIVGRRTLSRKVNLEGRSFLHDYDESSDPDLKKLELIMTAPMIVTNWINMQYYASTIDPVKFGSGNKMLNNVVGTIGCVQGNQSDLLGGLSEQSVRINGQYFHEPVRLQVFIEAHTSSIDQIIHKHQMVADLVLNGWLNITSISPDLGEFKLKTRTEWVDMKSDICH